MNLPLTPEQETGVRILADRQRLTPEAFLLQAFSVQLQAFADVPVTSKRDELISAFDAADDAAKVAALDALKKGARV